MMIKVGIVGLGFMAATHLKAYRVLGGVRIGAICSPSGRHLDVDFSDISGNLGTAEPLKLDMTFVKPYRVFTDMLANPEIHMIDICAPTRAHPELAIAALKAGKHVLCEKPLARTSQLAGEIVEVAKTSKGYFMPAMSLRFWPEWAWLKKAIPEKNYGEVPHPHFRPSPHPPSSSHKPSSDSANPS